MIDKISLRIDLEARDVQQLVRRHRLVRVDAEGSQWRYASGEDAKLSGLVIKVNRANTAYINCSLHKQYNRLHTGRLNNYGTFTMGQAREMLTRTLPEMLGVELHRAAVRTAEIGLTMTMPRDAGEYILRMLSVAGRELIDDPKFRENYQRITRQMNMRKVYKVYDKTGESRQKRRQDVPASPMLRIETKLNIAKDHGAQSIDRFVDELPKMAIRFLKEWQTVIFIAFCNTGRTVDEDRYASLLMMLGVKRFCDMTQIEYADGRISQREKQSRDAFAKNWGALRRKEYAQGIFSEHEREYFEALKKNYNCSIVGEELQNVTERDEKNENVHKRTCSEQKRRAAFFSTGGAD